MAPRDMRFDVVDYIIFALLLIFSAAIGFFYGFIDKRKKKKNVDSGTTLEQSKSSAKEYLLANKSMGVFPTAMSLLASFMSAITILGTPAEVYVYGTQYWIIGISYIFTILMTSTLFMPMFVKLEVTSAYEYLEKRFDRYVRLIASLIFSIQMIIYMALVLYAPALALSQVTGLNVWISVISIGVICTTYTTVGGMKAVMWTDVFQTIVMFIGLLASVIQGIIDAGGSRAVWQKALDGGRVEFFNFDPDPTTRHTVWSILFGATFTWLTIYGFNQAQVQRYLCVPTVRDAKLALLFNLVGLIFILSLCCGVGLVMFAKYYACDPLRTGVIKQADQLYPLFVMETLKRFKGLPGIFLACVFSGALSLAAVVLSDIIKIFYRKEMTDKQDVWYSKMLSLIFGVVCILITYLVSLLGNLLQAALSLFGVLSGPISAIFMIGFFLPWVNSVGALIALIVSLLIQIWMFFGSQILRHQMRSFRLPTRIDGCLGVNETMTALFNTTIYSSTWNETTTTISSVHKVVKKNPLVRFYGMSYFWYTLFSIFTAVIVSLVVSYFTGFRKPEDLDQKLMLPVFDILFPFLPEKILSKLRFGVRYGQDSIQANEKDEKLKPPHEMMTLSPIDSIQRQMAITDQSYPNPAYLNNENNDKQ
ncbi:unnamed protein product [Rotaria sp. Silwood2]|nr:unnamed protein product [Rotaria sp. Silwood2]CAF2870869.1 unnamed protein product [Rotaria sp. Silwood2]CAF4254751.1 unnamed protein product [Rotaria sp. Silwood2]CAF4555406.1 unnamed protein product [Rotaria sp. Silwood2]